VEELCAATKCVGEDSLRNADIRKTAVDWRWVRVDSAADRSSWRAE
jgi:hypothetical protein